MTRSQRYAKYGSNSPLIMCVAFALLLTAPAWIGVRQVLDASLVDALGLLGSLLEVAIAFIVAFALMALISMTETIVKGSIASKCDAP